MKSTISFFVGIFFLSCSSLYRTTEFSLSTSPSAPDYKKEESWAVLPHVWNQSLEEIVGKPSEKKADVFYVYPTFLTDKKDPSWNADTEDISMRRNILEKAVALQASAWVKAANLYVPFYRQAHYRIFFEPYSVHGQEAGLMAYLDVKNAFKYYLENYNKSKPIIIASHSQGAVHAKQLLKDFFDGKSLQKRLIAAYLIGARVDKNEFKSIPVLNTPKSTGGFVSWNTYKKNHLPELYEEWYKGGVVSNPITWDESYIGPIERHLGVLTSNRQIYPNSLSVQKIDGMLWSTLPKIKKRFLLSFIKNYHFADINLFWKDIQHNAVVRTNNWLKSNQK
ncbi:MAG: DUF3089 domain-containing protein [Flavobacteriales bacterium TMED235]|nr:MAG: DUF3089 domain-containing protein [Flavobacteriales bacterium TMED235]